MKQYKVPKKFYEDHRSRDLLSGSVVNTTKTHYVIELDDAAYNEMLEDAKFYSDLSYVIELMGKQYLGLARSAQATVKALVA